MGVHRPLLSLVKGGAGLFLAAVLASGCGGPSAEMRKALTAQLVAGDFAGAEQRIVAAKESSYGRKNMVLYYLDLGAVQHDAGKYKESDQSFAAAEQRMDELFTKSVSKEAGRFLLNDTTTDYAGERFERALVNVYRALDHLFLGNREGALVEARKLSRLLQEYADTSAGKSTAYKDDAFAQYITHLLYEDDGNRDSARISLAKAAKVYELYSASYGMPAPKLEPAGEEKGGGELVFIHANGVAPRKVSRSFQVAWNQAVLALDASKDDEAQSAQARNAIRAGIAGKAVTVAYPAYVQEPFRIAASVVEAAGRQAPTQLVEDVSAIAVKDLDERQALIKTRAIARATVKFALAKAAADAAKKKYGEKSLQAIAAQVAANVAAAATEIADTRAWNTVPAQFRLARVKLPPGVHDVTVRYMDASGAVLATRVFQGVKIEKGRRSYLRDRTAL